MSHSSRIGRYAFDPGQALPALSSAWANAYKAEAQGNHPAGLYALVQKNRLPPRRETLDALAAGRAGILQEVIEYEVVQTPNGERLGFILPMPLGGPLVKDLKEEIPVFREDDIRNKLIRPVFDTLVSLQERALFHGSISPLRLYAKANLDGLILGECVSLPPGYAQPALFEPIERAQCQRGGKGESTIEDDIYALGITAYLLAVGKNPFANMSDEALIRARIENGSATLMLSQAKLPPKILEFVRGVCGDHPKERWNFAELEAWIEGERLAQRSGAKSIKAARAIVFNGKEYFRTRELADVLSAKPEQVRSLTANKEVARWLQRSVGDNSTYEQVNDLIEGLEGKKITDEILAAKMAMALDPMGPVRYKKLSAMPSALGTVLCHAVMDKDEAMMQTVAEIIASDLISYWTGLPGNGSTYLLGIAKDVDQARGYIAVQGLGYGIERVLYELQPAVPCYSEHFAGRYILSLKQLLPALDALAGSGRRPAEPLDRHSAGFLAARMGRGHDNLLKALNPNKEIAIRNIAVVGLLASVQDRYGADPLPKLCAWMAETLKPALDRFHSRELRQKLQNNLNKIASQGYLRELQQAIDSPEVVEGDLRGFREARKRYQLIKAQIDQVTILLDNKNVVGQLVGQRIAAAISVGLGLLAFAVAIARAVQIG